MLILYMEEETILYLRVYHIVPESAKVIIWNPLLHKFYLILMSQKIFKNFKKDKKTIV